MGENPQTAPKYSTAIGYAACAVFAAAIIYGLIVRVDIFRSLKLQYEYNTYYLEALGQAQTGRLMVYGNGTGYFDFKLGPLVFYLCSLLLQVWASQMCLMVLSAALNVGAIVLVFLFFRRTAGAPTALFASAFLAACGPHAVLFGDTMPIMVLAFCTIAWIYLLALSAEKYSPLKFLFSFVFLAFAMHCHAQGFLLVPAGICACLLMRPRNWMLWSVAGIIIILMTYTLYLNSEIANGFAQFHSFTRGFADYVRGGGGKSGVALPALSSSFATNYVDTLGKIPGAAMIGFLAAGVFILARRAKSEAAAKEKKAWAPWVLVQFFGLAGLFITSTYSRFFIVYIIGACGTAALACRWLFLSRLKIAAIPAAVTLLFFMFISSPFTSYGSSASRFTTVALMKDMTKLFAEKSPSAADYHYRFHTVVDDYVRPGLIRLDAISTYLLLGTAPADKPKMEKHVLYYLKDGFKTPLDRLLGELLTELKKGASHSFYKSGIDDNSWMYCPGALAENHPGDHLYDGSCRKFTRAFRTPYESIAHDMYPEIDRDTSDRTPPPWRAGNRYFMHARIAKGNTRDRLIIVQTIGCAGNNMSLNGKLYAARGAEITRMATSTEFKCAVWFVVPSEGGTLGFDWLYDPKIIDSTYYYPELFFDVIDLEMPDGPPSLGR